MMDGRGWGRIKSFNVNCQTLKGRSGWRCFHFFFLPVTEYGEMGETEEEVADVQ